MTSDEVIQLVLNVQGTDKVAALKEEAKRLQKEFAAAAASMKGMDAATVAADPNIQRIAADLGRVTAELGEAKQAMNATKAATAAMGSAIGQATVDVYEFSDVYDVMASTVTRGTAAEKDATTAANAMGSAIAGAGSKAAASAGKIAQSTTAIASGASSAGYRLQVLGQGLDDLQYVGEMGLRPIIGNLMQISPAVGIVAIAINSIGIPAVKALMRAFDVTSVHEVKDGIKAVEDRIKVLQEKPFKFRVEQEELEKLEKELNKVKKAINDYNALMGKQTEFEAKSGKQIGEAIVELPGGQKDVETAKQAAIDQAMAKPENRKKLADLDDDGAKLKKELAELREQADLLAQSGESNVGVVAMIADKEKQVTENQAKREDAETKIREGVGRGFDVTVSDAQFGKGEEQAKGQQLLAQWLRHTGANDLADAIEQSSPKAMKANEESDEEFDASVNKAVESGKRATQGNKQRRKQAMAASDAELEDFTAGEQSRLDRTNAKREQANRAAQGIAKMYGGGVLGEDVGKAIAGGMDQAKVEENIRVVLAREGVDKSLQSKVARAMIANARQDIAQQRALNPIGDPNGVMPGQRPKRFVGKRNRAMKEQASRKRAGKLPSLPKAMPLIPVPSIGKMPELKIEDSDKSVSLQGETVGLLKRLVASNDEMARKSSVAILG